MAVVRLTRPIELPRLRVAFSWPGAVMVGLLLLVAYQTLVPLGMLAWFSITSAGPGEAGAVLTLNNYAEAYLNPTTYQLLGNTLVYAIGSMLLGLSLGVGMAWLVERTNTPLRNFAYVIVPVTAAIPGSLYAIAWVLLISPKTGVYNLPFTRGLGWENPPFQAYSLGGMIVVEGIRLTPTVFLMVVGLFRSMDPSLEEAAAVSRANVFDVLRRVTLPLLLPGILAVCIYIGTSALGSFESAAFLGMPGNVYVLSTRIWVATSRIPRDYGLAASLSMLFTVLAVGGILLYHRTLRLQQRFTTITGKGFRPRPMNLGRLRYVGTTFVVLYFVFAVLMPALILLWASLQPFYQVPSVQALGSVSLASYQRLFAQPWITDALRNTGIILICVPTGTMLLSALISWLVVRSRLPGRKFLDALAFLPHTMPAIVLGVAFLWMYLTFDPFGVYGTIWIIVIALITGYLAFGTRTANGAMYQLHRELEEAGTTSGATWLSVMKSITIPLLLPSLLSGWLWVAMQSVRELSMALLLTSPSSRILSVLIWNFWETGEIGLAAATGVLLMLCVGTLLGVGRLMLVRLSRQTA